LPPETPGRPPRLPESSRRSPKRHRPKAPGAKGKGAPAGPGASAKPDPNAAAKTADADAK
ncbi:MAG: hypothetical protein ACYTG0_15235, partial [Planctomycetota bacterium]